MKKTKTTLILISILIIFSLSIPALAMDEEKVINNENQLTMNNTDIPYGKLVSTEEIYGIPIETYVENDPEVLKSLVEKGIIEVPSGATPAEYITKRMILYENYPVKNDDSDYEKGFHHLRNIKDEGLWETKDPISTHRLGIDEVTANETNDFFNLVNFCYASGGILDSGVSDLIGWNVTQTQKYKVCNTYPLESGQNGTLEIFGLFHKYTYDVTLNELKVGHGYAFKTYAIDTRITTWYV